MEFQLQGGERSRSMIGTGSMTDPYIPLEMEIGNVRKARRNLSPERNILGAF